MAEVNIFGTLNNVTGEPIAKAAQIKDFTLNKTQAEINQIAMTGGFKEVEVDELPTASVNTTKKLYLVPSDSPSAQNTKDEYITVTKPASKVTYDGTDYPITSKGSAISILSQNSYSGPGGLNDIMLFRTSQAITVGSSGLCSGGIGVLKCVVPGENAYWDLESPKLGDTYTIQGMNFVCTSEGWTDIENLPVEYEWELIGSRPEQVEPVSSVDDMWKPVIEIFAAATGTAKPTGSVSTVYMRVNKEITEHEQWGSYLEIGVLSETCAIEYLGASFTATVSGNKIPASSTRIALTASAATDVTNVPTEFYEGGLTL